MSDNLCTVDVCDRPAGDGFVCRDCLGILRQCLDDMPLLVDQLEIVMSRQAQYGVRSNGGGGKRPKAKSTPLMFDVRASDVLRDVHGVLGSWAKMLAEENGWDLPDDTTVAIAAWLWGNLETIRTHEAGGDMVAEVSARKADALHAIDRPAESKYLGTCGAELPEAVADMRRRTHCDATLWGRQGKDEAICKSCGASWRQEQRQKQILDQAATGLRDRIYIATEAAIVLIATGQAPPNSDEVKLADRIRKLAAPRSNDRPPLLRAKTQLRQAESGRFRPGYRLGDIVDLLAQSKPRRAA